MKEFFKRDEEFICKNCGKKVSPLGYTTNLTKINQLELYNSIDKLFLSFILDIGIVFI